ncbi:ribonuclease P protein subunit [Nesidiocoris tenuis]|uniref:Ribonuclease P protein subunit p29 n=1 Tax=Nesidiocoris tenuis TaxID=355587 RepID=A0ABN7AVR5_9HEMI|nr:ribonuclease P protein subunit [Nesidiocoris tenuis]
MKEDTFAKLPAEVLSSTIDRRKDESEGADKSVKSFLESRMRKDDAATLKQELHKKFPLAKERQVFKKRIRRRGCPKNQTLSNTKKKALGLYNIERDGLQYKDLLPLHDLWKGYMDGYLGLPRLKKVGFTGDVTSPLFEEVSQLLFKADYHGAIVRVTRSTAPSLVGLGGIIVFETRNTLKVLGKDNITRCLPKLTCEFEILVGDLVIRFLGKNFLVKPPDRAAKKVRGNKRFL